MKYINYRFFLYAIFSTLVPCFSVAAQIIPDNTLGAENSEINSIDELSDRIEGGAIRGDDLFHSFQEFNVESGASVNFANPDGIANIFSRVTGNSISEIFGSLGVEGAANLFLMNPNGIVFGENSAINVNGSFLATTAEDIEFDNGDRFSATSPNIPTLTINFPIGLGFGSSSGDIEVEGRGHSLIGSFLDLNLSGLDLLTGLEIDSDQTLALIGGNLSIDGGVLSSQGGNIKLGSVREGNVGLSYDSNGIVFNYQEVNKFGNLDLTNNSAIFTRNSNNNLIDFTAENISLTEASFVRLENSNNNPGGNIAINTGSSLKIDGISPQLVRSGLFSINSATETGANIDVTASSINVSNGGGIVSSNKITSLGKTGDIRISTNNLAVKNGSPINTATFGIGDAGNISIDAKENITLSGFLPLAIQDNPLFPAFVSQVSSSAIGTGKGGDVNISSRTLNLENGGNIATVTNSTASAGSINIDVDKTIKLSGTTPFSISSNINSSSFAQGNTGDLIVDSQKIIIERGAGILVTNLAAGNAGKLKVNASDSIQLRGTSSSNSNAFSSIRSSAIIVEESVRNSIGLPKRPSGRSGNLDIYTSNLFIDDGAQITVANEGIGNAGNLSIDVSKINLDNNSQIAASTVSGQGGNITLNSDNLLLSNQSNITTNAGGEGNGGNITVDTEVLAGLENSDISANAIAGNGGNIDITSDFIFGFNSTTELTLFSDITASSELGIDGTVTIFSPESNIGEEVIIVGRDERVFKDRDLVNDKCSSINEQRVRVQDLGIPIAPSPFDFNYDEDLPDVNGKRSPIANSSPAPNEEEIIQANTVKVLPDGRTFLVAETKSNHPVSEPQLCTR